MRKLLLALFGCGLMLAHSIGFAANGYCDSNSRNTFYFWQQSVTVGEVEIASGVNGGYNYVPDSGITLQPGSNTIDLNPAYRYYNYTVYWRGWLDLNGDNQFTSDEQLFETSSNGPVSVSAELPANFAVESTTLRIAMKYGSYPAACEIYYYGETEDLVVQLPQPEPEPEPETPALEDTYHLTLDSNFTVSRDGAIGDNAVWVVEKNGAVVVNRNAGSELEYQYFSNTSGADFRIWLEQYVDGEYQRVSNIVAYTPGTTDLFALNLSEGYQINRSGELGVSGNLTWVIEMDGNIVLERLASNELDYVYYRNWDGTHFRVWLKQVVDGQYKVVSNTVEYQTNQTEFTLTLDQKYKLTRNGQPGDQVRWIVEENGLIIEDRDASNEQSYTFVNSQPGSRYLMWLQMNIDGQEQVVSNVVTYDEPVAYDFSLGLNPGYQLKRSGTLGDNLTWVIVKDGNMALQRGADNELSYTYFGNTTGSYIEAYLQQFVGGYYQRVSNVVRYEVKDFGYTLNVDPEFRLLRSGGIGEPLVWVIEEDGVQVLQQDASQADDFIYPGNTPGASYRAWLAMVVDGTLRPVSNVVYYQVPVPLALDIALNPDFSVSRSGKIGDPVNWIVEENGNVVWNSDASNALTFQYPSHNPGAQYRVWLESWDNGQIVSNLVEYIYEESEPNYPLSLTLLSEYTVQRDGYIGDPVGWVIEENGIILQIEDASQALSYQHPNHVAGAEYRIWLQDMYTGEQMSNDVSYTYGATAYDYQLTLNEDYTVSRSGVDGDMVWWRVERNGVPYFDMPADADLTLYQVGYEPDQVYTVRLMDMDQTVDVAEPVRFTYVEPGSYFTLTVAADGSLTRDGYEGDPVWWVIEEDGVVIHEATALESLTYVYPDLKAGSSYRFWLVDYVTSQKRVVSNLVSYTPDSGNSYEYQITLSGDGRIARTGNLGEPLDWVVMEGGEPVMWFNASNDLSFNYEQMLPVGSFQVYLEFYGEGAPYQVSNMLDVTVP